MRMEIGKFKRSVPKPPLPMSAYPSAGHTYGRSGGSLDDVRHPAVVRKMGGISCTVPRAHGYRNRH